MLVSARDSLSLLPYSSFYAKLKAKRPHVSRYGCSSEYISFTNVGLDYEAISEGVMAQKKVCLTGLGNFVFLPEESKISRNVMNH